MLRKGLNEGFYIKFIVDINDMNVETFENWIRKNDNVLKFITIMELNYTESFLNMLMLDKELKSRSFLKKLI